MDDDDFLILVNAWWESLKFVVPADLVARRWAVDCDTYDPARKGSVAQELSVGPRSAVVAQSPSGPLWSLRDGRPQQNEGVARAA